jgi:hypothetical protein
MVADLSQPQLKEEQLATRNGMLVGWWAEQILRQVLRGLMQVCCYVHALPDLQPLQPVPP